VTNPFRRPEEKGCGGKVAQVVTAVNKDWQEYEAAVKVVQKMMLALDDSERDEESDFGFFEAKRLPRLKERKQKQKKRRKSEKKKMRERRGRTAKRLEAEHENSVVLERRAPEKRKK
jgi:hypothetical protein